MAQPPVIHATFTPGHDFPQSIVMEVSFDSEREVIPELTEPVVFTISHENADSPFHAEAYAQFIKLLLRDDERARVELSQLRMAENPDYARDLMNRSLNQIMKNVDERNNDNE